jgi:2-amino-4-hydroxy-6-hydroxymethyldihydropteridine diphosphokinase
MLCYIGAGSNLGDRLKYIGEAVSLLVLARVVKVLKVSPVYETAPEGGPKDQGDYLNCVFEIESGLAAEDLLVLLKAIEKKIGRTDAIARWAARRIDLDLLFYGDAVIDESDIRVPHPLLHERVFVLKPLADLAPGLMHPVFKKDIRTLLGLLATDKKWRKLEEIVPCH